MSLLSLRKVAFSIPALPERCLPKQLIVDLFQHMSPLVITEKRSNTSCVSFVLHRLANSAIYDLAICAQLVHPYFVRLLKAVQIPQIQVNVGSPMFSSSSPFSVLPTL
jgi:hypothetical protein